jgi:hypothetical protein
LGPTCDARAAVTPNTLFFPCADSSICRRVFSLPTVILQLERNVGIRVWVVDCRDSGLMVEIYGFAFAVCGVQLRVLS